MKLDLLFVSVGDESFIGSYSSDGIMINKHHDVFVEEIDIKRYKMANKCFVEPISFAFSDLKGYEYCNRLPYNLKSWGGLYRIGKEHIESDDYFGFIEEIYTDSVDCPMIFNKLRYSSRFVLLNYLKELGY